MLFGRRYGHYADERRQHERTRRLAAHAHMPDQITRPSALGLRLQGAQAAFFGRLHALDEIIAPRAADE
jgi:hypothetical protein